uniref:chitinase n=1 Tax=Talaromyces marneffei PM1 TaxID=1077442 RepID=A0A093XDC7_TALMA
MQPRVFWLMALVFWAFDLVNASPTTARHSPSSSPSPVAISSTKWESTPQLPRNSSKPLPALFKPYSPDTPVFMNQELIQRLSSNGSRKDLSRSSSTGASLFKRDLPVGECAPGTPCTNGACCSNTGVCSYAPSSCAPDVCISNCNATAPCGQYAAPGEGNCPLNVCCSQYGFCGTTPEFCGSGCQAGYGSCGEVNTPSCSGNTAGSGRRVGYYQSWANDPSLRLCDLRTPDDLDLTGLTHINFAFAFFDPQTFSISPMSSEAADLYRSFTGLKAKKQNYRHGFHPNTRTAFSDMVSNAANRRAFIGSLQNFMQTYGFNGVDIDWEYPAASDRGGVLVDTANFAELVAEMRSTWGTSYGISVTLPSSYWYLQGIDVTTMQRYVDWFNFMSYDIHGVWDATDRYTGPYIRPHTNLTEIREGLDLLWMAGVSPSLVNLGIGWYGRSFTLADSSCTEPNGVCKFTQGGSPGQCTNSAGTLSISEIKNIYSSGKPTEYYDSVAAVRWMTWDNDQWVSFDDGITTQQKVQAANDLCLGGILIWAMDMDNSDGDAMNDLLGIGQANGVTEAQATDYKEQLANATLQSAVAASCYWTLCGQPCNSTYFDVTEAIGQVANVQQNSVCQNSDYQTLCCAPGTIMGTCAWEGWRGVGMPCSPVCSDPDATIVAQNSNSYGTNEDGQTTDLTCTGGFQAYCCSGFVPSSKANTGNMFLYGQGIFNKRDAIGNDLISIQARGLGTSTLTGALTFQICAAALAALIAAAPFTFGTSLLGIPAEILLCAATGIAIAASGFASKPGAPPQKPPFVGPKPFKPRIGGGPQNPKTLGQWPVLTFPTGGSGVTVTTSSCDCSVTYTCVYGMGWDEICDNQRWAIDKLLNGQTVFAPDAKRPRQREYTSWRNQRREYFRSSVQGARSDQGAACELDEFPMGDLAESTKPNPQACRLVNGIANGKQGIDYKFWKSAQWTPCSSYRVNVCGLPKPPATWKFGPLVGNRGATRGAHFVTAYGFDSQTANSLCFASYTYTDSNNQIQNTMVADHGFRALNNDPIDCIPAIAHRMYGFPYSWPRQRWTINPAPKSNSASRPSDIDSASFLRRDVPISALVNTSKTVDVDEQTCYANPHNDHHSIYGYADNSVFDIYQFEDMVGNSIDGHSCDIIYVDEDYDLASQMSVRPDGSFEYIWGDEDDTTNEHKARWVLRERPLTSSGVIGPLITAEPLLPHGTLVSGIPETTTSASYDATDSRITAPPRSVPDDYVHCSDY